MITGLVNADLEAVIRLQVRGQDGRSRQINAVVDTGFNGCLTLSPELIGRLHLTWRRRARAILADGNESVFDVYSATVVWDRQPLRIPVDETHGSPLVGMSLLEGHELNVQVRVGGKVTIKPLR